MDGKQAERLTKCLEFVCNEFSPEMISKNPMRLPSAMVYKGFLERTERVRGQLCPRSKDLLAVAQARVDKAIIDLQLTDVMRVSRAKRRGWFAPWKLPLERRLQTLTVLILNFFTGLIPLLILIMFLFWYSPVARIFLIAYAVVIKYEDSLPVHVGIRRRSARFRSSPFFKYLSAYFPIRIVQPSGNGLDPRGNYLFGYHPHGVHGVGAVTSFGTDIPQMKQLFPGLQCSVQTLRAQFLIPFWREIIIMIGCGDAAKKTITAHLTGPGRSTCIVVGGATESILSSKKIATLYLKQRLGFIKLAMQCGAQLVPVYAFGENDLFRNLAQDSPRLRKFILRLQKMLGWAPLLVHGRGVFTYTFGMLPFRKPVFVVFGDPIAVEKTLNPSSDDIHRLHEQYVQALTNLYETYQMIFAPNVPLELL